MSDNIPCEKISTLSNQKVVEDCAKTLFAKFSVWPSFFVRVPGRVNLIGEHIDYCGYGVFPMAIQQDVMIAVHMSKPDSTDTAQKSKTIKVTNLSGDYEDFTCTIQDIRSILENRVPGTAPAWYLYFLCGALGVLEHLNIANNGLAVSLEACVIGRIPPRAGLSSSSALVSAAALAILIANGGEMSRTDMANLCAKSERYIGTQGGGMDQAIGFFATKGSAQFIEFQPKLTSRKVYLPKTSVFVIANSLSEANKAANSLYNTRVAECQMGTWILATRASLTPNFDTLGELQKLTGNNLQEMVAMVEKELHEAPYGLNEIAEALSITIEELNEKPIVKRLRSVLSELPQFKLKQRAKHVYQEAFRVLEFRKICETSKSDGDECDEYMILKNLGNLMTASHNSLRDLYECSHPQLDRLVSISLKKSHGARLTGAGWGGCMVALVDRNKTEEFVQYLQKEFYEPIGVNDVSQHVFISEPGQGAMSFIIDKDLSLL